MTYVGTQAVYPTSQRGFTLIELMITITVMVILVGGGLAGFITFRENQQVLTSLKEVQQMARDAQTKARVRETPSSCNADGNRLQGYRLRFNSATSVTVHPLCGSDAQIANPGTLSELSAIQTKTLSGVTLSGYPTYIDFYTLHRGLSISTTYTLKTSGFGSDYCFDIESGGAISDVVSC